MRSAIRFWTFAARCSASFSRAGLTGRGGGSGSAPRRRRPARVESCCFEVASDAPSFCGMGSFLLSGKRRCAARSRRAISAMTRRSNRGSSVIRPFDRRRAPARRWARRARQTGRVMAAQTALASQTGCDPARPCRSGGPGISSETRRTSVTLGQRS